MMSNHESWLTATCARAVRISSPPTAACAGKQAVPAQYEHAASVPVSTFALDGWKGSGHLSQSRGVAHSPWLVERLVEALWQLQLDGARRVHLFGHSMGARVVAAAAPRLAALFQPIDLAAGADAAAPAQPAGALSIEKSYPFGAGVLELASVTLLSPDMELGEFVGRAGPALRSVCPLITIYGDRCDQVCRPRPRSARQCAARKRTFYLRRWCQVQSTDIGIASVATQIGSTSAARNWALG